MGPPSTPTGQPQPGCPASPTWGRHREAAASQRQTNAPSPLQQHTRSAPPTEPDTVMSNNLILSQAGDIQRGTYFVAIAKTNREQQ